MKVVHMVHYVILGLIIYSTFSIGWSNSTKQHQNFPADNRSNIRSKRGLVLLVPSDSNESTNDDAHEQNSSEFESLLNPRTKKKKRDSIPSETSKIFMRHNDMLDAQRYVTRAVDSQEDLNDASKPYIRMKSITDRKEIIKRLLEARKTRKRKRNAMNDGSVAILIGRKINRPRGTRRKKYTCYCQETRGPVRRSLRGRAESEVSWTHDSKDYEYEDDASPEQTGKRDLGVYVSPNNEDHNNKVLPIAQPMKFNIPFSNSLNVEQRVARKAQQRKRYRILPLYQRLPINHPANLLYRYNNNLYGDVYTGVAAAPAQRSDFAETADPSNYVDECVGIYGPEVCATLATNRAPAIQVKPTFQPDDDTSTAVSQERDHEFGESRTVTLSPWVPVQSQLDDQLAVSGDLNNNSYARGTTETIESRHSFEAKMRPDDESKNISEDILQLPDYSSPKNVINVKYAMSAGSQEQNQGARVDYEGALKNSVLAPREAISKFIAEGSNNYSNLGSLVNPDIINEESRKDSDKSSTEFVSLKKNSTIETLKSLNLENKAMEEIEQNNHLNDTLKLDLNNYFAKNNDETEPRFKEVNKFISDNNVTNLVNEFDVKNILHKIPKDKTAYDTSSKQKILSMQSTSYAGAEDPITERDDGYIKHFETTKPSVQKSTAANINLDENLYLNTNSEFLENVESTETSVQSVDERPTVVYENNSKKLNLENPESQIKDNKSDILYQNAVKKVINNFIPGKVQDLLANYGNKNMMAFKMTTEELQPEILDTPVLKNLLSVPEVEDMIIDTTSNFMIQLIGSSDDQNVPKLIRKTLHDVIDQIPHPHPTVATLTTIAANDGPWVTERVSLLEKSGITTENPPKEVIQKIETIINRSALKEQAITQPIVENFIIKAVKHSLDKEHGVINEFTIRQAFDMLVRPKPTVTKRTLDTDNLKVASTTEYNDVSTQKKEDTKFENSVKTFEDTIDKLHNEPKIPSLSINDGKEKQVYESGEVSDEESSEELIPTTAKSQNLQTLMDEFAQEQNKKSVTPLDDSIEKKVTKYYSPNDIILNYIKTHSSTNDPAFSAMTENIRTTRLKEDFELPYITSEIPDNSVNMQTHQPVHSYVTTLPSNINQFNLLVEPKEPKIPNIETNTKTAVCDKSSPFQTSTENDRHAIETNPIFLGKLLPVNYDKKSEEQNGLTDLQNSQLMYVGDGVRLPMSLRKLEDGSFALTLSDEMCKRFVHKTCPCCLPSKYPGLVVRERRSGEIIPQLSFTDDEVIMASSESEEASFKQIEEQDGPKDEGRAKKELISENSLLNNFDLNNENRKNEWKMNNEMYEDEMFGKKFDDRQNEESIFDALERIRNQGIDGPPYLYQRYAQEDKSVSSRTKALKNVLHWMKNFLIVPSQKKR